MLEIKQQRMTRMNMTRQIIMMTGIYIINECKNHQDGNFKYKARERHWAKKQIVGNDIWQLSAWLLRVCGIMILWYCDYYDIWWLSAFRPLDFVLYTPSVTAEIPHLLINIFGHEQNAKEELRNSLISRNVPTLITRRNHPKDFLRLSRGKRQRLTKCQYLLAAGID